MFLFYTLLVILFSIQSVKYKGSRGEVLLIVDSNFPIALFVFPPKRPQVFHPSFGMMSEDNLALLGNQEMVEILGNFNVYLGQVCSPLLFGDLGSASVIQAAVATPDNAEAVVRYATSSECSVLLVERLEAGAIRIGLDVRMPTSTGVAAYVAVIKAFEAPLHSKTQISSQVQIMSMTVDASGESSSDEINQAFFARLHQVTRHYYAPLARLAKGNSQVHSFTLFLPYIYVCIS